MVKSRIKRAPAGSKPARKAIPSPLEEWKKAARAANAGKHEAELARIYESDNRLAVYPHVKLIPNRKYEWDFVVSLRPDGQPVLAIEVQGNIWRKGGHNTGLGIMRDAEKANLATIHGYRTLFFTPEHIADGRALLWTLEALGIE